MGCSVLFCDFDNVPEVVLVECVLILSLHDSIIVFGFQLIILISLLVSLDTESCSVNVIIFENKQNLNLFLISLFESNSATILIEIERTVVTPFKLIRRIFSISQEDSSLGVDA